MKLARRAFLATLAAVFCKRLLPAKPALPKTVLSSATDPATGISLTFIREFRPQYDPGALVILQLEMTKTEFARRYPASVPGYSFNRYGVVYPELAMKLEA